MRLKSTFIRTDGRTYVRPYDDVRASVMRMRIIVPRVFGAVEYGSKFRCSYVTSKEGGGLCHFVSLKLTA